MTEQTTSGVHIFPTHEHPTEAPATAPATAAPAPQAPAPVAQPAAQAAPKSAPKTALRTDGPTLAEWVEAGYNAANYPPSGYAPTTVSSASTPPVALRPAHQGAAH